MSISSLYISSKMCLKFGPARHKRTTPKALPEPYTFFQCILSRRNSFPEPL